MTSDCKTPQDFVPSAGTGGDDRPAIQAAINSGCPVYLPWTPAGYNLAYRLVLPQGSVLTGSPKKPTINCGASEWIAEITGHYVTVENVTAAFPSGGSGFLLRTDLANLEHVTIRNVTLMGANTAVMDLPGQYKSVLLKFSDIVSYGTKGAGIYLRRAFAYLYGDRISILQDALSNQPAFRIVANEGSFWTQCDATNGTVNASNTGNHGFQFENCQAVWVSQCMADTVGGNGFDVQGGQFIYFNQAVSSLAGGKGLNANGVEQLTWAASNVGGRAGTAYAPSQPGIYISNSPKAIIDDASRVYSATGTPVQLVNCAGARNNALTV